MLGVLLCSSTRDLLQIMCSSFSQPYKGKLFSASADRTVKAFDLKVSFHFSLHLKEYLPVSWPNLDPTHASNYRGASNQVEDLTSVLFQCKS